MIKVVLWDIDGTLLNFLEAEKSAIRQCFSSFGLGECSDKMLAEYSEINSKYWKRLELGELSKQQVLEGRFYEFFENHGLDTSVVSEFNMEYQIKLGDTICFNDNAYEVVSSLVGRVKQYAVTNGTRIAQERKLAKSGLEKLFDGVFISDVIGIEKPMTGFFDAVWEQIGDYQKDEIMIVGDSLTSDIQGGNNAGIICCWYNPDGLEANESLRIDYEIDSIGQVTDLLTCE